MFDPDNDLSRGDRAMPDDPREAWRSVVARPGGNQTRIVLTERQIRILNIVVDELIPPGGGFPAPSSVGVVDDFIPRYVTPHTDSTDFFPHAKEREFTEAVDRLGGRLLDATPEERVAELARLEAQEPEFFGRLRTLTYAGYYSRPQVVFAIREVLEAGRDYHGPPLPYGYADVTVDWTDQAPPAGAGSYISTDEVTRVVPPNHDIHSTTTDRSRT